jgi:hypothetical protein
MRTAWGLHSNSAHGRVIVLLLGPIEIAGIIVDWQYKRTYRTYRNLELDLRIKPGKRLGRDKHLRLRRQAGSTKCGRWTSYTITVERFCCSMCSTISTAT